MKKKIAVIVVVTILVLLVVSAIVYMTVKDNDAIESSSQLTSESSTPVSDTQTVPQNTDNIPNQSDPASTAIISESNQPVDPLKNWARDYVFFEYDGDQSMRYEFTISEEDGVYIAHFYIFGFQTLNEFQASINGDTSFVDIIFDEYVDYNMSEPFSKGDLLLTLKQDQSRLLTYWGVIQPMMKEHESGKKNFSVPTSAEASWPDIWNKEAESLKDTVLVNEMDNERGLVHLGMTKDELISVLDSIGIIFDVMESDTGDRCYLASFYLFEDYISICINHDVVDGIEIDGSIPLEAVSTQSGLNLGDSFNTMIQLYGEDYTIYETEDSGKIYEYVLGDHYFQVCFLYDVVFRWGISEYKFDRA